MRAAIKRFPWTTAFLLLALAAFITKWALPRMATLMPACPLRTWTGWNCPGCGGTRCASRLLSGELMGAFTMNPIVVIYGALLTGWIVYGVICEWSGKRMKALPSWTGWALAGALLVFACTRNLPWWPFTLLAPH
jgi:hypothetical protein